jgi:lipopolysaccharide export system protein LptA
MAAVAALTLVACLAPPVAGRAQAIDMSSGGPVNVTAAGGFDWNENQQTVTAHGDARAVRGNVTVLADQLLARYRKKAGSGAPDATPAATPPAPGGATATAGVDTGDNEVYRLEAEGHVRIVTPTDEAIGDRAVYDIDQAVLVLTGHDLKLTTPQQIMTARDSMEYWSQKRMAVGRGHAVVVTTDGRRLAADILVGYFAPPTAAAPAPGATAQTVAATSVAPPPADPVAASGKLERVEAFGNVEVRTATDTVFGDRGLYLPDTGIARIVGHVRITHGQNQINGPAADVNMKTGVAHMISIADKRVQGLIMPNDTQSRDALTAKPK